MSLFGDDKVVDNPRHMRHIVVTCESREKREKNRSCKFLERISNYAFKIIIFEIYSICTSF